jgi:hypothetical protein
MNFTFGIVTDYSNANRIQEIVSSIRTLQIPKYEILIVSGKRGEDSSDINYIFFDDVNKPGWVTTKKNIIASEATFDNIVVFHDYYVFDPDWYKNYLTFGEDWDVCSNAQHLITGKRHFTDWVTWDSPLFPRWTSLRYDDWGHTRYMYQSGGYMLIKKKFLLRFPMNDSMGWGTGEDVEWSLRMRDNANWKCNGDSLVKHNKEHRDAK